MKVIIHDLNEEYDLALQEKCDKTIMADGKYAPCQGCFDCWMKTPAKCKIKDSLSEVCRVVGKADELVVITRNFYGTYSPNVKNVIDRSIGISTPLSTYRKGQMHHVSRYGWHKLLKIVSYGDITDAEKDTFILTTKRNALNHSFESTDVLFIETPEELGGMSL